LCSAVERFQLLGKSGHKVESIMPNSLRLLCILAHPDDESLGTGGILAKYKAQGVDTFLVTATRGQLGWPGPAEQNPGPEALGAIREGELRAAAEALDLDELTLLDYHDGHLARVDPREATAILVGHLRRIRPQVVVTFDPFGAYGHPDHIAVCQWTTAAVVAAADSEFASPAVEQGQAPLPGAAHRVSKLYYMVATQAGINSYQDTFGELRMVIDGQERRARGWDSWAITTRVDTAAYWRQVWLAISCHQSQVPAYETLMSLPEERRKRLWSTESFYRAFSLVDNGPDPEDDLFAGLR
jgi:LmbE family N-acetylglucosaminyl deacetylase